VDDKFDLVSNLVGASFRLVTKLLASGSRLCYGLEKAISEQASRRRQRRQPRTCLTAGAVCWTANSEFPNKQGTDLSEMDDW